MARERDDRFRSAVMHLRDVPPQHEGVKAWNACIERLAKELLSTLERGGDLGVGEFGGRPLPDNARMTSSRKGKS